MRHFVRGQQLHLVRASQEKFEALLPLYITADHFNRALPLLKSLLRQLAPEHVPRGGGCPPPETWLEVLSKILNTQVVLLADNGITASQRSLAVTCQVYRCVDDSGLRLRRIQTTEEQQ